jgi:hypothetical protein
VGPLAGNSPLARGFRLPYLPAGQRHGAARHVDQARARPHDLNATCTEISRRRRIAPTAVRSPSRWPPVRNLGGPHGRLRTPAARTADCRRDSALAQLSSCALCPLLIMRSSSSRARRALTVTRRPIHQHAMVREQPPIDLFVGLVKNDSPVAQNRRHPPQRRTPHMRPQPAN